MSNTPPDIPHHFSAELQTVLLELEALEETFEVELQPDYTGRSGSKQVRLWSIPLTTGTMLYEWVCERKPAQILELGTSAGYSTLWLAAAAQTYGGHVTTVDSSEYKLNMAQGYFERVGLADTITTELAPIGDALEQWETPLDFVFIDADKKNTLRFIKLLEPHLTNGAYIVVDDAVDIRKPMENAIEYLHTSPLYEAEELAVDHGLLVAEYKQQ